MNSIKYNHNNTIYSKSLNNKKTDKIHKSEKQYINIISLKEVIPTYYKYLSLIEVIEIYDGRDYKYKNLEIECRKDNIVRKKIIKVRLNIIKENKPSREKYFNIYLPYEMKKSNTSLEHKINYITSLTNKINDIILLINMIFHEFNFEKEVGFQLYIDNIQTVLKYYGHSEHLSFFSLLSAVNTFAIREKENHKKKIEKIKELKKTKELKKIQNEVENLEKMMSNIHTTLIKYE